MPALKKTITSSLYRDIMVAAEAAKEHNDCGPRAIAVATGKPYDEVHALCKKYGRKDRQGTYISIVENVCKHLGFSFKAMPYSERQLLWAKYPPRDQQFLKHMTTHHPRRFAKAWRDMPPCIFHTEGHFAGFRDGQTHDWAVNSARRIITIYVVQPL